MRSQLPEAGPVGEDKTDTPRIRINVLGRFQLIRGETSVTEKEWSAARKPQLLLKALITRGAKDVPVDQLIDDLWPEASQESGRQNFNVVLHRLRKVLGHPASGKESHYVSLEANRVSLNGSLVALDIDEFVSLHKRAKRAEQEGDIKGSIGFGNSAIALYKGDYLEDEPYIPWTMLRREETRALYRDILGRTASQCERQGNSKKSIDLYKLLIKADPLFEEAYRKLMLLYSNIGMRSEAIRVYDECRRVLGRELGVEPDDLTTSIYRRILEDGLQKKPIDLDRPGSYTPKFLVEKILSNRNSIEGERKIVTVLFADVADSTSLFDSLDPEAVHEIMDGCFRLILDVIHRFEGTVNQFLGDGVMALFGAPIAHEDHAQRACHAALAIQGAMGPYAEGLKNQYGIDFKMRIGLNSGPVVVGSIGNDLRMDYMARGDTVNLAAAVGSRAEPGGILATKHLYKLAGQFFELEPLGSIQATVKEKSVEAYRLIRSTGVETKFAASVARGLTRFIGRTREIRTLKAAFDRVMSGEGRVIGISGEPGVGKSRLLLEFRNSLPRSGCRYLEGRCFHYGESMPYLPLLDVIRSFVGIEEGDPEERIRQKLGKKILGLGKNLRKIIPPLQELLSIQVDDEEYVKLEPKQRRERTFEALRDLLIQNSRLRPTVLAIEDLHWIDRTTEEFLDYMIRFISETGILLILLYRNEYNHQWGNNSCYGEIALGQLSMSRSEELVAAILQGNIAPELRELIFGKAEGNPFFMEELTRAMVENGSIKRTCGSFIFTGDVSGIEIPDTIQGVLAARMDRLEEGLKRVVQVAAVIGREFAFRILEMILGMQEGLKSRLANLQRLEFILKKSHLSDVEYIFRHALTQEVAYNSLLLQRRREIHERIGKALEELYPQRLEEFCEMLAWHYSHSNNQGKACQYLKLSGQKAARSNSHREAFRLFKEALEVMHKMPGTRANDLERLEILRAMAGSMRILGYPEGSIGFLREGEGLAGELGEKKTVARFFASIGYYYLVAGGDPVMGKTYIERCLSASELIGEVDIIAPAIFELANFYSVRGELSKICEVVPKCFDLIEKTQTQFETFGMPVNVYSYLKARYGLALGSIGSFDAGERAFADSYEFARQACNTLTLAFVEMDHGAFYFFKGDGKNTVEHCKAAAELSEKCQMALYQGVLWAWTGAGYLLLEQPQKALENMEKGLRIHLTVGIHFFLSCIHAYLGLAHLQLGNQEKALVHAEQAVNLSRANSEENFLAQAEIYLGMVLGARGPARFDEAREHILLGIETSDKLKFKPMKAVGCFRLGELSASLGLVSEAAQHLQQAGAMFRQMGMDYWLGKAQNALAKL